MRAPLVSIPIPAYNAEQWLGETLQSAIAQTWPNKEIIVVDDGSKDQTVAVARQFEAQGVRVVTQKNSGAAASRNTAFAHCHGEYIQWLDADDLLAPDKIASQLQALLHEIQELAIAAGAADAEAAALRLADQVDRIAAWGSARQRAWSEYLQYVHRYLRDGVRP